MNSRINQPQRGKGSVWYVNSKPRRSSEDSVERSAYALNVAHTMQRIEGNLGQNGTAALTAHDTDIYDIPDNGSDDSSAEFYDRQEDDDDELLSDGSDFSDGVRIYDDPHDEGEPGNVEEQIYEIDIFEGGGTGARASNNTTHGAIPVSSQGAWSSTPPPPPKTFTVIENKAPGSYENVEDFPPPPPPMPGLSPQVARKDVNRIKGEAYKGKVALLPPRKQRLKRTENDSPAEKSRPNPKDPGIEPSSNLQRSPHSTPSDSLTNELTSKIATRSRALSSPIGQRKEPSAPTFRRGSDTVHMESDRMNPTPNSVPIADELAMKLSNRIRAMNMGDGTDVDVQSSSRHHGSHNSSSPDQTNAQTRAINLGITDEIGGRELYYNVDIQHGYQRDQEEEGCPTSPSHERIGQRFDPSKSALQPAYGRRRPLNEENGAFNVSLRDAQDNAPPIPMVQQKKKALVPPHLPKDAISFEPRSPVMTEWKMAKQTKSPAPKPAPKPPAIFDETYENTEIGQVDVRPMSNSTKLGNTYGGVEQDIQIPRKYMQSMTGSVVFSEEAETVMVERTDLQEYLHVGDRVLQIAGIDVRNSCAAFVTECWKRTSENPVRIKVLRR